MIPKGSKIGMFTHCQYEECGRLLTSRRFKYCSELCGQRSRNNITKECWTCGKKLGGKRYKFCNNKCTKKYYYYRNRPYCKMEKCLVCSIKLTENRRRYCSTRCKNSYSAKNIRRLIKYYRSMEEHSEKTVSEIYNILIEEGKLKLGVNNGKTMQLPKFVTILNKSQPKKPKKPKKIEPDDMTERQKSIYEEEQRASEWMAKFKRGEI